MNEAFREVRDVVNFNLFDNYNCKATDSLSISSISHNTADRLMRVPSQKTQEFRNWMDKVIDTSANYIARQQAHINIHAPKTDISYENQKLIKPKSNLFY